MRGPSELPTATPTGPSRLVPSLDGARTLAVALVVLTHAAFLTGLTTSGGFVGRLLGRGDFGVGIFFALSAYLLHSQLLVRVGDRALSAAALGGYALRRLARVLPAYWVCLLTVVAFAHPPTKVWVAHLLGLQIYLPHSQIDALSQSWSVATELSFYAVLPLAVVLLEPLRRRSAALPSTVLLGLAALALAGVAAVGDIDPTAGIVPERLLTGAAPLFVAGLLLAEARRAGPGAGGVPAALHRWARDPVGVLGVAGATYILAGSPLTGSLVLEPTRGPYVAVRVALGAVVALLALLPLVLGGPNLWRTALAHPVIRWVGQISYGIFLWHVPVFVGLYAATGAPLFRGGFTLLLVVGLPLAIGLATVSHYALERPVMRWATGHATAWERGPTTRDRTR